MRFVIRALLKLTRAFIVAAVIVAGSGIFQTIGRPLFAAIGEIALNLAAVRSEADKLRQQAADALRRTRLQSIAFHSASGRDPGLASNRALPALHFERWAFAPWELVEAGGRPFCG